MADASYTPKVYHKQGGDEHVIANGGIQRVESGGQVVVESGGKVFDNNGAPGAGVTDGTGTVFKSSIERVGDIIRTTILVDLTGLSSSTTDLDIIGTGLSAAYLGQITAAKNGTIFSGRVACLEAPVGGVTDIDLYSATEATGVFDGGIAALTETALLTSGGAWTLGTSTELGALPAADQYLYLTGGAAGTAAAYTAGKFTIELEGYVA